MEIYFIFTIYACKTNGFNECDGFWVHLKLTQFIKGLSTFIKEF